MPEDKDDKKPNRDEIEYGYNKLIDHFFKDTNDDTIQVKVDKPNYDKIVLVVICEALRKRCKIRKDKFQRLTEKIKEEICNPYYIMDWKLRTIYKTEKGNSVNMFEKKIGRYADCFNEMLKK